MLYLIVYDINLENENGKSRLRKIAKLCEGFGVRVQNSVFEVNITLKELEVLKNKINNIIDKTDSIRIYQLHKSLNDKLMIMGHKEKIELSSQNSFIL